MRSHRRPPVAPTPSEFPHSQDTARENPALCWACWASLPSPFLQHSFHPPHVSPVNASKVQRCSDNGIFNHKGPTVAVPTTMFPPTHALPTFWDLLGQRLCDLAGGWIGSLAVNLGSLQQRLGHEESLYGTLWHF